MFFFTYFLKNGATPTDKSGGPIVAAMKNDGSWLNENA
jgi:hypothetical protein